MSIKAGIRAFPPAPSEGGAPALSRRRGGKFERNVRIRLTISAGEL